jgi:hypothetical protein
MVETRENLLLWHLHCCCSASVSVGVAIRGIGCHWRFCSQVVEGIAEHGRTGRIDQKRNSSAAPSVSSL